MRIHSVRRLPVRPAVECGNMLLIIDASNNVRVLKTAELSTSVLLQCPVVMGAGCLTSRMALPMEMKPSWLLWGQFVHSLSPYQVGANGGGTPFQVEAHAGVEEEGKTVARRRSGVPRLGRAVSRQQSGVPP